MPETIVELTGDAANRVQDIAERRSASKEANAKSLPGPLADAFAIPDSIRVGKYLVRPVLEVDMLFLQQLEHPLYKMLNEKDSEDFKMSGPLAWQLCYIFTHDVDDVELAVSDHTLKANAQKEFGRLQIGGISKIVEAVMQQLAAYAAPIIGYGNAEDGEGSKKNAVQPQT